MRVMPAARCPVLLDTHTSSTSSLDTVVGPRTASDSECRCPSDAIYHGRTPPLLVPGATTRAVMRLLYYHHFFKKYYAITYCGIIITYNIICDSDILFK